jgi:hypothetical protein
MPLSQDNGLEMVFPYSLQKNITNFKFQTERSNQARSSSFASIPSTILKPKRRGQAFDNAQYPTFTALQSANVA